MHHNAKNTPSYIRNLGYTGESLYETRLRLQVKREKRAKMKEQKETDEELQRRKSIWIARATSHFDSPEIRKEASDMFDKANK